MRRLAQWLAVARHARDEREFVLGDLEEEFDQRRATEGAWAAHRWYWRAAGRSFLQPNGLDRASHSGAPRSPGEFMRATLRDVVIALRRVRTRPLVSVVSICTVALGIGANVAMFSVAWPVLAAPLPFPDEDRLTVVSLTYQRDGRQQRNQVSLGDYNDWRTARSFASMAAYSKYFQQLNMTGRGDPEQLSVGSVTSEFFTTLGVRPLAGRLLQPADARSAARLLVLSERAWRRRFAADPAVVGSTVRLDGVAYEVIGVAPAFAALGTIDPEAWMPAGLDPSSRQRGAYFLGVIARLSPDVTLAQANHELRGIMERAAREFPQFNSILSAEAESFRELSAASVRTTLLLLLASAGLVLAVAIVNLIGLQLARMVERTRELTVRRALGASAWQVGRQLLTENMALAALGGIVGMAVALGTLNVLESIAPTFGWTHLTPASRATVAGVAVVLTLITGLLVGAGPAWRAARSGDRAGLQVRHATAARWGVRARSTVVAVQVGATVVLLVVATLVMRSQREALSVDTGFDFAHAVAADVNVPSSRYDSLVARTGFYDRFVDRLGQTPGISGVCLINEVPLDRGPGTMTFVPEGETRLRPSLPTTITPACPDVLGIPLVEGRWFTRSEPSPSVVVTAALAQALFPDGRSALGRRIHLGLSTGPLLTVVGVSADVRLASLEAGASPVVWMPHDLGYYPPKRLLAKYDAAGVADPAALRAALRDVDPDLALANVRSMDDIVARATSSRRFALFLLGGFALTAVVLSAVGIYGVLAHVVGARTLEIGIRVALGARPSMIVRLILVQVAAAVAIGAAAGLWGATTMSSSVDALLYGVTARDVSVYLAAGLGVTIIAGLAAWMPTRRALRIDPVVALRNE